MVRWFWNNPLLVKEYRARMRSVRSLLLLIAYLLAMGCVIFGYIWSKMSSLFYFNPGNSKDLFLMLTLLQLVLIAFVVPGLTATAISVERERQTLGLLLTTRLSPTKIVLSKLLASLSYTGLLVFSTLPLYAIIFLYGGVSPLKVVGVFFFYLLSMILFGSIGMFCSAWFKRTAISVVVAYLITFLLMVVPYALAYLLMNFVHSHYYYNVHPGPLFSNIFYLSALDPLTNLLGYFEPGVLMAGQEASQRFTPWMQSWVYYMLVYMPVSALLLFCSVRQLMPVKKPLFRKQTS